MIGLIQCAQTVLAAAGTPGLSPIDTFFQWFWTVIVFASIAWYTILLFWLGTKGGIEIGRMIRVLKQHLREQEAADGRR